MKHYINTKTSEVHAFESDGSQDNLITQDMTLMTATELSDYTGNRATINAGVFTPKTKSELLIEAQAVKTISIKEDFHNAVLLGFTTTSGITMNSLDTDIRKLKEGYDLAIILKQLSMAIRDFHNATHTVLLPDVLVMCTELGLNYQTLWLRRNTLLDTINNAKTVATVKGVVW